MKNLAFVVIVSGMIAGLLPVSAAMAEVAVENQVVQSGLFVKPGCKPAGDVEGFNECNCVADIHVPVIKGLTPPDADKQINSAFAAMAAKQQCEGNPTESESQDESASSTFNFEISYQSPVMLGLRFESWAYSGGAHGNGAVAGAIVDVVQGKLLGLQDVFKTAELPVVNKYIHDALSAEPEGEVFHDSIEGFKGVFLTPAECKSCTLVLAEDGLKVVFQTYAVSSFANGPMEVLIPPQFVAYPALVEALKNVKPVSPPAREDNALRNTPPTTVGEK